MCVSRFSIPSHSGGEYVAVDLDFSFHRTDEPFVIRCNRQNPRNGSAMLGHDDASRLEFVQNRQALGFKFRGRNDSLFEHIVIIDSDHSSDQFIGTLNYAGLIPLLSKGGVAARIKKYREATLARAQTGWC